MLYSRRFHADCAGGFVHDLQALRQKFFLLHHLDDGARKDIRAAAEGAMDYDFDRPARLITLSPDVVGEKNAGEDRVQSQEKTFPFHCDTAAVDA